jgi:hypothetical protein
MDDTNKETWRDSIYSLSLSELKERITALDNKADVSGLTDDEQDEKEALAELAAEQEEDDVEDGDDDDLDAVDAEVDSEIADKDV